jgi:hypothetical protein
MLLWLWVPFHLNPVFAYRTLLFFKAANTDINDSFKPDNNRYLAVHEYSGLESGDAETAIRDFISSRTDANCSASKRLHAIW